LSPPRPQKNQRGQALVFSLITVGIIILVMVTMYSMGQQSISKTKLQNTADAAAYSAVQAEARDYNFSAYTTRAMIANQVAVAQMVGLASWSRGFADTYNGPAAALPTFLANMGAGLARFTWGLPVKVLKPASKAIKTGVEAGTKVLIPIIDGLISILSISQTVHHYGTALTIGQTIGLDPAAFLSAFADVDADSLGKAKAFLKFDESHSIIKRNDSQARLSDAGLIAGVVHMVQWFTFVQKKDPNAAGKDTAADASDQQAANRLAQVTMESLDDFSINRNTNNGGPGRNWPGEMMYPIPITIDPTRLIPMQSGALLMFLWHRGGTELKQTGGQVKKTWSAMDATGFFGFGIFWIPFIVPIPIPLPFPMIPMGSGAAQAGPKQSLDPTNNFVATPKVRDWQGAYGGAYTHAMTSGSAAIQRGKGAGATLGGSAGLRSYFDVKKTKKSDLNMEGPSLILEIEKDGNLIASSNSHSGGQFTLTNGNRNNSMRSLSKAQVYFSRPKKLAGFGRADKKTESGSLYSPYWQARLVPNNIAEQYFSALYHTQ
jgi:Flp pilus assembly protein TadG